MAQLALPPWFRLKFQNDLGVRGGGGLKSGTVLEELYTVEQREFVVVNANNHTVY